MSSQSEPPAGLRWVDARRGLVSREIFVSDDVCKLEMERIFNRSWIFLGHETELPKPGDFVSRNMGNAPVVVVRDNDGKIHALLNSCRHRGAKYLVAPTLEMRGTSYAHITGGLTKSPVGS